MDYSEKWKTIETLGEGGQGKVYRVLNMEINASVTNRLISSLRNLVTAVSNRETRQRNYDEFSDALLEMLRMQDLSQQAALKVLHKPEDARDPKLAVERIRREIDVMSQNLHPNLIEILDIDPDSGWYVSKLYSRETLADRSKMFKGNLLKALKALRPIVEGVAVLHEKGYVHRDIKPENIFLNSQGHLVLGDFGLVHFEDDKHNRISLTYENVGTRDWMPPWAMGMRIDKVKPSFDAFSLGKVLWSMISGKPVLQLWYFNRESFNVEKLFPKSRPMPFANLLFAKCIVEEETDCLPNAGALLQEIDKTITRITFGADPIDLNVKRPCKVCGIGDYVHLSGNDNAIDTRNFGLEPTGDRKMRIFTCSHCGNIQLFSYAGKLPPGWQQ